MAQSSDRIVRGLRAAGVRVDVAQLTHAPRRPSETRGEGGHHLVCPVEDDPEHALRRLWIDIERLHRGSAEGGYTHVLAFGGTLALLAGPTYARWLGAALITLLRGNDFDTGLFSVRRRETLLAALTASAAVTTVASSNVALIEALLPPGRPGPSVEWITNGIDAREWEPLPSERARAQAWRHEHVEGDRTTIGLIGQLKRKKGAVFFLEALAASRFAKEAHVVLVGDAEPELLTWLADHATAIASTHLPFLDRYELLGYYPACDIVALPSFYDGLPNVALEAAALGLPLLVSDAGGLRDLVVDGEHGFVFPAGDRGGCRAAIDRALALPGDRLVALGAAGRARVQSDFTAAAEAQRYVELLTSTT
jgi:glycosyltransferase involved in cell wall biosynthesis